MKILMVCLGNICRSPLAEGILREKIRRRGLPWKVESAGMGSWHRGEAPDPRAQAVALAHGIDISTQRAKQFHTEYFSSFDRIFAMDAENYADLMRLTINEDERRKIEMICNLSEPGKNRSIPDPYYDDDLYETVFSLLDDACDALINKFENAVSGSQETA